MLRGEQRKMHEASTTVADASREVDQCRSENSGLRDQIDRLNQEKSIVLKRMHDCEQQVISGQAEIDVLLKKNKALEGDVATVREEKRRVERQLSLSVGGPSLRYSHPRRILASAMRTARGMFGGRRILGCLVPCALCLVPCA
jgi:uncharacterized protein (DUF3084 family)